MMCQQQPRATYIINSARTRHLIVNFVEVFKRVMTEIYGSDTRSCGCVCVCVCAGRRGKVGRLTQHTHHVHIWWCTVSVRTAFISTISPNNCDEQNIYKQYLTSALHVRTLHPGMRLVDFANKITTQILHHHKPDRFLHRVCTNPISPNCSKIRLLNISR